MLIIGTDTNFVFQTEDIKDDKNLVDEIKNKHAYQTSPFARPDEFVRQPDCILAWTEKTSTTG